MRSILGKLHKLQEDYDEEIRDTNKQSGEIINSLNSLFLSLLLSN